MKALVTGGSSGIGAAVADRLAADGHDVVVADLSPARTHTAITAHVTMDVSDPAAWTRLMADHGPFDIAFLNAGVTTRQGEELRPSPVPPLSDLTDDQYRRIMGANIDGVVFGIRAVLPAMVAAGHGDIVCTASMAGLVPMPMDPIYGLTKHAVVGLVRAVAAAAEGTGVHVSAFCPGFIATPLVGEEALTSLREMGVPVLEPDAAADAVVHALEQRVSGAQWVLWGGEPPKQYTWNPPI